MANVRKRHPAEFKAKVALAAIRQQKTTSELTAEYGVLATQISAWKKQVLDALPQIFSSKKEHQQQNQQAEVDGLYRQLGQVVAERDWLKKKSSAIR